MSYFKTNLQKNLRGYSKYFGDIKKPVLRTILQVCVAHIETRTYSPEVFRKAIQKLESSNTEISENFVYILSGLVILVQSYLRAPKGSVKDDELRDTLKELKFSDESCEDICKVLINHRQSLSLSYHELKCLRRPLTNMEWRVNITLMDTRAMDSHRLAQPSIILQFEVPNRKTVTFEMSLAKFHRLRFSIATLLKEIMVLERRQIMRK